MKDGGPAFPFADTQGPNPAAGSIVGMSLRDYFAGQALASFAANSAAGELLERDRPKLARYCYGLADQMIQAREAKK